MTYKEEAKKEILKYLLECKSIFVWGCLDYVATSLSHNFPIAEVANWLFPDVTDIIYGSSLDDRSTSLIFLRRLMKQDLRDTNDRLQDSIHKPNIQKIVTELSASPSFEVAINTWLSICVEWLAICNVDEILERLKERYPLHQNNVNIAKLLVGALELAIR